MNDIQAAVDKEMQNCRCSHCGGYMPPITVTAILAVVDEVYSRNISEENWHSRVRNAIVNLFEK